MPEKHAMDVDPTSMAKQLIATLGAAQVLQVARESRWLRRLRDITPLALVVACLSTLGASKATWIADILRTFNAFTGLSVRNRTGMDAVRDPSRDVAVRGWKDIGPIGGRSGSRSSRRAATHRRSLAVTA